MQGKKIWVLIFLCLMAFPIEAQSSEKGTAKEEEMHFPDPLNLQTSWWNYFNVDQEELAERVTLLKTKLDEHFSSLAEEEHEVIHQLIDNIKFNLDIFVKKSEQTANSPPSLLQLLNHYTDTELLHVNSNLHHVKIKLQSYQDRLDLQKTQMTLHQRSLDDLITLYQHTAPSSLIRLKTGMEILNHRLELANLEAEQHKTKQKIHFYQNEHQNLAQELTVAQERLLFTHQTPQSFQQAIDEAAKRYQASVNTLHQLRKRSFYEEEKDPDNELACCLWSYKVMNQFVITQIDRVQLMIEEIKFALFSIATQPDEASTLAINTRVKNWNDQLERVQTHISNWEHTINDEQARIGTEVAQALQTPELALTEMNDMVAETHFNLDQIISNIQRLKILQDNASLLNRQIDSVLIKEKTWTDTWWLRTERFIQDSIDTFHSWTKSTLFRINETPVTLLNLIQAVLIIIFTMVISGLISRKILQKQYISKNLSPPTKYILSRSIHYFFVIVGFLIALSFIGIDFSNFIIIAGALGVGIGFGLQSMANNIISGFLLLFQRMIKVDDIVELENGLVGHVRAINLQNTHITSLQGIDLIVPNSKMTSEILHNWTFHDRCRRYTLQFAAAYGADKNLVRSAVIQAIQKLPFVKQGDPRYPDPEVWLGQTTNDCSLNFELTVWVDLSVKLQGCSSSTSALLWEIETALTTHDILPSSSSQRNIYIKEVPDVFTKENIIKKH